MTLPANLTVNRRFYANNYDTTQVNLGSTPLKDVWVPKGYSRYRLEQDGQLLMEFALPSTRFATLDTVRAAVDDPHEMVRVPGGVVKLDAPGLGHLDGLTLGPYLLDRYETTNREFKRFVEVGGYRDAKYWRHPFGRDGKTVSFDEAMRFFVDRTGRPGPSTWEAGDYAEGTGDHPVGGISWYEAAAYAEFAGKSLPTIYHWLRAASTSLAQYVIPASNFNGKGTTAVGAANAMSQFGNYDMGGNVREWCYNGSTGERYILGGGFSDQAYQFTGGYAQPPWDRSRINGVRLARYPDQTNLEVASRTIELPFRDYAREKPAGEAEFQIYARLYEYDQRPLAAKIEHVDSTTSHEWVLQQVSYDAGYGNQRLTALLYLPRNATPPYQTIIHFPGSNVIHERTIENATSRIRTFDFIIKSGRAVIFPVFKGTLTRATALRSDSQERSDLWRDHMIAWVREYRRTVDLTVERVDLDEHNIAYYGLSWGSAAPGGVIPALEPRIKTVVYYVGGMAMQPTYPEVDPLNFLPRIKQPAVMGRRSRTSATCCTKTGTMCRARN